MSADLNTDLASFHQFISVHLAGSERMTPEEALELWRLEHPSDEQYDEDCAAVQAALDDIAARDKGTPLEEFDREFRARYGVPRDA